jgi:anti-repressor protein
MELIKINESAAYDKTVSCRDLHEFLEVETKYNDWFNRMTAYGFMYFQDYQAITQKKVTAQGNEYKRTDHEISLDMAKEICMIQRSEKGQQARRYFIEVEKQYKKSALPMSIEDMMIQSLEEQKKIKGRIQTVEHKLENQMTIDHASQRKIQKEIALRVYTRLLENGLPEKDVSRTVDEEIAYPKEKRRYFAELHREIKDRFAVSSYTDVKQKDFDSCINYIKNWIEKQC